MDKILTSDTREGLEKKIDIFLGSNPSYQPLKLVLPAQAEATLTIYRSLYIRHWKNEDKDVYDTAFSEWAEANVE